MAKVAIKSENITSFGGIYHVMDVFSKLGFEKCCGIKVKINIPLFLLVSSKGIVTLLFVNTLQIYVNILQRAPLLPLFLQNF